MAESKSFKLEPSVRTRMKQIRMLILDVDGVLTDGRILLDSRGKELKVFHASDGYGIHLLRRGGIKVSIISGRRSEAVVKRAEELHIDALHQGVRDKLEAYSRILESYDLRDKEVCYIGDDLSDIPVLSRVGVAVAVPNARPEVRKIAHHTTSSHGGQGAVREVAELLLRIQGMWKTLIKEQTHPAG
jgi:3-deoxy-D-manno-octulosonate 8-phosphate phosphatase (KDO 8-P phosphatase)